jgi:hypothetical protein
MQWLHRALTQNLDERRLPTRGRDQAKVHQFLSAFRHAAHRPRMASVVMASLRTKRLPPMVLSAVICSHRICAIHRRVFTIYAVHATSELAAYLRQIRQRSGATAPEPQPFPHLFFGQLCVSIHIALSMGKQRGSAALAREPEISWVEQPDLLGPQELLVVTMGYLAFGLPAHQVDIRDQCCAGSAGACRRPHCLRSRTPLPRRARP